MNLQLKELQQRHADFAQMKFSEAAPGYIVINVSTDDCEASLAMQGAQVMTWRPTGADPVVWLSPAATMAPGKSLRGGAPICWPWFGAHEQEAAYPGHGFARTIEWALLAAQRLPDNRLRLEFAPQFNDAARMQWPHPTQVRNIITLGRQLEIELATTNTGAAPFKFTQGLHTYFHVSDCEQVRIDGLDGCDYYDKAADGGGARRRQNGPVTFAGEVNRIYLDSSGCCEIHDPQLQRRILVTSTGSRSTVVWNPGVDNAARMGDFGPRGHRGMICVETTNAGDDIISLAPGETHRLAAQYRAIPA